MKLCWNHFVKGNQQGPSVWFGFHKIGPCWSSCMLNNDKEIRLKALSEKWLKEGKGSLFYFAMG